jgi:glycosyltransferase involved in cell wall biosynthesis
VRIGILDCSSPHWTAGETYTRTLLAALEVADKPAGTSLVFFRSNAVLVPPSCFEICDIGPAPSIPAWRGLQESYGIDVLLPLQNCALPPRRAAVGWIPDFQHIHLPHLFASEEITARDRTYTQLAESCQKVIVSSQAVSRDFSTLFPKYADKACVLPFPSLFASSGIPPQPGNTVGRYCLPRHFALVPNQFWTHKNHAILPPASAALRIAGRRLPIVLTGVPADYRNPANTGLSEFFQAVAQHGVHNDIYLLGAVSREELLDLLRSAALIIQPSLSEGWNTTLEDAKALGVPIACSDLQVHREQCGEEAIYFDPRNPQSLADALSHAWSNQNDVHPTYLHREKQSLERAKVRLKEWGDALIATSFAARESFTPRRASHGTFGNRVINKYRLICDRLNRVVIAFRS